MCAHLTGLGLNPLSWRQLDAYGWDRLSSIGEFPGVVHRLDRGTSGVMVVAKTDRWV